MELEEFYSVIQNEIEVANIELSLSTFVLLRKRSASGKVWNFVMLFEGVQKRSRKHVMGTWTGCKHYGKRVDNYYITENKVDLFAKILSDSMATGHEATMEVPEFLLAHVLDVLKNMSLSVFPNATKPVEAIWPSKEKTSEVVWGTTLAGADKSVLKTLKAII